jgi:hypothetical protein
VLLDPQKSYALSAFKKLLKILSAGIDMKFFSSLLFVGLSLFNAHYQQSHAVTLDELLGDMEGFHEKQPNGVPESYNWSIGPVLDPTPSPLVNSKGEKMKYFTNWGQIYAAKGTKPVSNTRVQLRNIKTYYYSKKENKWKQIQNNSTVTGKYYVEDFANDNNIVANERKEDQGGVSVKLTEGYNYHFCDPNGRAAIDTDDFAGVATTVEARLIMHDSAKPDDRDDANYILSMGGDYWVSKDAEWESTWNNNFGASVGKFRAVTKEWKSFSMHNLPDTTIIYNPPPFVTNTSYTKKSVEEGTYIISAQHSKKVLDIYAASTGDGASLITWSSYGTKNQQWKLVYASNRYYRLVAVHSNKPIDVKDGSTASGAQIHQWSYYQGVSSQLWKIIPLGNGYYRIQNKNSNKVLGVSNADMKDGAKLVQQTPGGGTNQRWALTKVSGAQ